MSNCLFNDVSKPIFFYETYKAIHLHFTSNYDFFKFRGKLKSRIETKTQVEEFMRSNNYGFSVRLAKKRRNKLEMVEFLLANIIKNNQIWLCDLLCEDAEETFVAWKKRQDSLTYTFINDINFMLSHNKHFNNYFVSDNNEYPDIVMYLMNNEISLETVVIIDKILGFTKKLGSFKKDFILIEINNNIQNYKPFLLEYHNLDGDGLKKFKKILHEKAEQSINVLPF